MPRGSGQTIEPRSRRCSMATWTPDPSSILRPGWRRVRRPRVGLCRELRPDAPAPDEIAVVDLDPASSSYAQIVGRVAMPGTGDELHHLAGMPAAPACAPMRRTPMSRGAIWSCRGCAPRASISSTPTRSAPPADRQGHRTGDGAERAGYTRPQHRALRARRHLRRRARQRRGEGPGGVS